MTMVGADPEFFIFDEGRPIPAVMVLESPIVMKGIGYIQADGIQFECNPIPDNAEALTEKITALLERAKEFGEVVFAPTIKVEKKIIAMAGAFNSSSLQFGCSPDLSIYGERASYRGSAIGIPYRFAGAHIHIDAPPEAIKVLDRILGLVINEQVPNVNGDNIIGGVEGEALRRQYYGRAGIYRKKEYGSEWRVPSSAILNDFGKYLKVAEILSENWEKYDKFPLSEEETKNVINSGLTYPEAWNYI